MGFLLRWLCAFLLLAATFNPTEFNYVQWVRDYGHMNLSLAVLFGLLLGVAISSICAPHCAVSGGWECS